MLTALMLLTMTTAGCDRGDSVSSKTPAATPSSAASDEALIAYRSMWEAMVEAGKTSDSTAPALHRFATAQALELLTGSLDQAHRDGVVFQGRLLYTPKADGASAVDATKVRIVDCVDDTQWTTTKSKIQSTTPRPGGRYRTTAVVNRADGSWKVSTLNLGDAGTC